MSRGELDDPGAAYEDTLAIEGSTPASEAPSRDDDFPILVESPYDRGGEVARGGLGRIVAAVDRRLGRTVALKELVSRDPKAEGRFVREAKITARLEHPNIVPIHEAGRWPGGGRFYAMKLVDGKTLSEALAEADIVEKRLALLPHVIDVADAVAYAHTRGILHRDLKPANVMVGQFGETLLIDWGLAKDLSEPDDEVGAGSEISTSGERPAAETSDGIVVGTPPYMSPEQARADPLDERSDVYALGAMLYQVLTGRRPYEEVPPREVLHAVVRGPPRAIEELAPDLPRDLIAIVKKAMHRRPGDRYPSAREMAEELRRFTTGQLVGAHRYSPVERTLRFLRRNATAVAVASTFMVVLVLFAAWSFNGLATRAEAARVARSEAERRVRELTLEKARSLMPRDPTEAAAWLAKVVPPVRGTASAVAEALDAGVALAVLDGHVQEVDLLAVSPDGAFVVSGSRDGTVRVWTRGGEALATLAHGARMSALDVGPSSRWLATGAYDGTIRLYRLDALDAEPVVIEAAHAGVVTAVQFAPTGDRLVSMGRDDRLVLWTLDGKAALRIETPEVTDTPRLEFMGDGRRLISGHHGRTPWLWDLSLAEGWPIESIPGELTALDVQRGLLAVGTAEGEVFLLEPEAEKARLLGAHGAEVRAIRFSPDGARLASGSMDGEIDLWVLDENRAPEVREAHEERVTQLRFSPDGRWLASSSWDGTVRAWELATDETRVLRGHAQVVTDIEFAGPSTLVSSSWDTTIRIWPLTPTGERLLRGHRVGVHAVAWSPDGRKLASGGHDDEVRLWDPTKGSSEVLQGHEDHVYRVVFSPDGRWVASSSDDRTVRLWSTDGASSRVLGGYGGDVEELAFSPDGKRLASASRAGDLFVWTIGDSARPRELRGHDGAVTGVAFGHGGRLVSAGVDGRVLLWPPDDSGVPRRLLTGSGPIRAIDTDPAGKRLAAAGSRGEVWVWSLPDAELVHRLGQFVEPDRVRLSPDLRFVAVASAQRGLWLCNLAYELCDPLVGHDARVFELDFAPDGRALASASGDHSVRLWDVDTLESRVFRGHRAPVFDVAIGPRGTWVASASGDADVRVFPLALPPSPEVLPELLRELTHYQIGG